MIILIDNYDSFTHNLLHLVSRFYSKVKVIRNDELSLQEVEQLDPKAYLISPGPGKPEQSRLTLEILRHTHKPTFGVCLGMQALAHCYGAKVVKAKRCFHGKVSAVLHHHHPIFAQVPKNFNVARYHSLVVDPTTITHSLQISAQTSNGVIMGLHHKSKPFFGVQFHPESILSDYGDVLIENFLKIAKVL